MPELEDHLIERTTPDDATSEGWRITDVDAANWAMRKLRKVRQRAADINRQAANERERIDEWEATELGRLQGDDDRFEGYLTDYHRRLLAEDPKRKTVRFPSGELRARKAPDQWSFEEELFIKFAESHDLKPLVRVKKEVDKPAAKKTLKVTDSGTAVTADGEIVEGVTVEEGEITYKVEPDLSEESDAR